MRSASADIDRLFDTLSNPIRRQIVCVLAASDADTLTHETLVDVLTDRVPDTDTDSLRISLHHLHLPKLATTDLITYDRDTHRVRAGPRLDAADHLLNTAG